jgi:Uma2 family endonuclease
MREPPPSLHPTCTWEDFLALPDDDRRELVDGELVALETSTEPHEHIVATFRPANFEGLEVPLAELWEE